MRLILLIYISVIANPSYHCIRCRDYNYPSVFTLESGAFL